MTEEGVDMTNEALDLHRAAQATVALGISAYDGLGALFLKAHQRHRMVAEALAGSEGAPKAKAITCELPGFRAVRANT